MRLSSPQLSHQGGSGVYPAGMTSKFTAFDVTVGNCFLLELEREDSDAPPFRVLVDTGNHATQAADFIAKDLGLTGGGPTPVLDVVVVTHTDADHLNGLSGVLDLDVNVSELWLPYLLAKGVYMVFKHPAAVADAAGELVEQVSEGAILEALRRMAEAEDAQDHPDDGPVGKTNPYVRLGEDLLRELSGELRNSEQNSADARHEPINLETLVEELLNADDFIAWREFTEQWFRNYGWRHSRYFHRWIPPSESSKKIAQWVIQQKWPATAIYARGAMFAALCTKAEDIKKALAEAFRKKRHMKVRFFEYEEQVLPLQPPVPPLPIGIINAKEVQHIPAGIDPATVLALFVPDNATNHTSLVLHAPATARYPAALLTADSDFIFAAQPSSSLNWTSGMLITAPHHGSPKNGGLAQLYRAALGKHPQMTSIWVRSDKKLKSKSKRPADWWRIDLKTTAGVTLFCTCCKGTNKTHTNHVVATATGSAEWKSINQECTC